REVFRVILICPECGARYVMGWRVSFHESGSRFMKTPVDPSPCVPPGSLPARTSPSGRASPCIIPRTRP
ncbi:MAG: hypothetical protein LUO98_00715, partial [Methanoregula sp.]|nr:hypothetical protein [Methanoregula sp.]